MQLYMCINFFQIETSFYIYLVAHAVYNYINIFFCWFMNPNTTLLCENYKTALCCNSVFTHLLPYPVGLFCYSSGAMQHVIFQLELEQNHLCFHKGLRLYRTASVASKSDKHRVTSTPTALGALWNIM